MDSPERSCRSHVRRDREDSSDLKSDKAVAGDDEEWGATDSKKKHKSSKSRKPSNVEEGEGVDSGSGSGRRKSSGDRTESRKRLGASTRADSDEDDYDTQKPSRSKQIKRKQEESSLEKLSSWYEDGELESRQDGDEKSVSKGHAWTDETDRKKVTSKLSKSKKERSHDEELEKSLDRDSRYSERKESIHDKGHGSSELSRNTRRRWDESDASRKAEENSYERPDLTSGKASDLKYDSAREKSASARNEPSESKSTAADSNNEKGVKSDSREERKIDAEKSKNKGRSDALKEDNTSPLPREDRSGREKIEKHRQQRTFSGRDVAESRERTSNMDDDGMTWMRDKNSREVGQTNRSRTPERSSKCYQESELFEMDLERSVERKIKERERDDRSKSKDDIWSDQTRDREGSKENWKRRQLSNNDKESKNGDIAYDHGREWDLPRHGRERNENERPHGRPGNTKDGNRGEAVKTSSNFGISNDNYDVIEIQTKPLDYRRAESGSNFPRRTEIGQQSDMKSAPNEEEWAYMQDNRGRRSDAYGSGPLDEDSREKYTEDCNSTRDPNLWNDELEYSGWKRRGQKPTVFGRCFGGQSSSAGSQPPYGNHDVGTFGRAPPQGVKGSRIGRGGRGRPTGRDNQQVVFPMPMMGSPFAPLGMPPPGPMQPINPSMSPAPGPPNSPGVFIPPFSAPVVWPGPRAVDMNMLCVPPGLSPVLPGPSSPQFPPNIGGPPNPGMHFNQSGRGPSNVSLSGFNGAGPMGRGIPPERTSGGWVPPRTGGPPGKAPFRGEQNDYSQNFVDTDKRPQNFIRELELTNVVEDYPKLRELIQKKDEIVAKSASPPMYMKCDLREFELSPDSFGTKFDVILIDPPWEEYVHRAPGVADHIEYWTFEEIMNLKIEAIADTPSFIFLWVGDGVGLEQGRQCLKKWGFRRCEDICWVKTNKTNATPGLRHNSHTILQHSKEHCLMGIKGTVRRSTDGHIIHANIDTDVIIAEEPSYGSTQKPEDIFRIIEHFALGRRRLELFGEDHNIRSGWLTVGKGLSSSNFNTEAYIRNFVDKDGKVWQGWGGRNPPPDAPHLVKTTPEIEALRPKSPIKNQQQMQQQPSTSISLTSNSSKA